MEPTLEFKVASDEQQKPCTYNGNVENAIKTATSIMKKAKQAGTDPYLSLLDWRNTPSEGMPSSPTQRMFQCRTRTLLPITSYLLKPKVQEDVKEKLLKQKSKQAKYNNQNTKELPPLQTGEVVRVAPKPGDREQKWVKARVEDQVDVSYEVGTEDGRLYGRNRRHLCQSNEPFGQTSETSSVQPPQDDQPKTTPATAEPIRPQLTGQPVQDNFASQPKQTEPVTVLSSQEPPSDPVKPRPLLQSNKDFRK